MELYSRFLQLPRPATSNERFFTAERIKDNCAHRIARDGFDQPAILIKVDDVDVSPVTTRLSVLTVFPQLSCHITSTSGPSNNDVFTVISAKTDEPAIQKLFVNVASNIVDELPSVVRLSAINDYVNGLIRLFRALSKPPTTTALGLWGELLVIDIAADPFTLLRAWHAETNDVFDFSLPGERLEVKSTKGPKREHRFSVEQLSSPPNTRTIVASLIVSQIGSGLSLASLVDRVRNKIGSDTLLLQKFDRLITESLGSTLPQSFEQEYDENLARASLRYFEANEIPAIRLPLPEGVSTVSFTSNLEHVISIDPQDLGGPLISSLR